MKGGAANHWAPPFLFPFSIRTSRHTKYKHCARESADVLRNLQAIARAIMIGLLYKFFNLTRMSFLFLIIIYTYKHQSSMIVGKGIGVLLTPDLIQSTFCIMIPF